MRCPGLHCDGCRHGHEGVIAAAVLVFLVAVGVYGTHRRAIDHAVHVVVTVLEVAAIAAASAAGIAVVTAVAVMVRRRAVARQMRYSTARVIRPARWATVTQLPTSRVIENRRDVPVRWPLPGQWREIELPGGGDDDDIA